MKIRFEDLKKVPKGTMLPPEANGVPRKIIREVIKDPEALALFDQAERERRFGKLVYPLDQIRIAFFHFRYGVCQRYEVIDGKQRCFFVQSLFNDAVTFSKEKNEANHDNTD
jgi:hypothetical protein